MGFGSQMSHAEGVKLTFAMQPFVVPTVIGDGQVIEGAVLSVTVTVKLQTPVFAEPSVAVQFTVVKPSVNVLPLGGEQVTGTVGSQLSEEEGINVTTAPPSVVASIDILLHPAMLGACASSTFTVNVHCDELLDPSVAIQVTVVLPFRKIEPLDGEHETDTFGQLSVVVAVYVTAALHASSAVFTLMSPGQVIQGFSVSVAESWIDVDAVHPFASVTEKLCVPSVTE